jgi:hypothetical protein
MQSWCFLTRFIIDLIEDKSQEFENEVNTEENRQAFKKHFAALLEEWLEILCQDNIEND